MINRHNKLLNWKQLIVVVKIVIFVSTGIWGTVMKKLHLFILTLVIGATVTINSAISANFSSDGIQAWILDALLVAALIGFIAVKYLKSKGKLY